MVNTSVALSSKLVFRVGLVMAAVCVLGRVFAQSGGSTTLHDFGDVGDRSSLRTNGASIELVEGGNVDRDQALRISFDAVPDLESSPGLVFEKSAMPVRDFSQIEALSFWVKNESGRGCYISITAQDVDEGQSWTSPDRFYISPGEWRRVIYRLELQGLDRKRIVSLHLTRRSVGPAMSLLFDDFELLSPLAGQLAMLEDRIRRNIANVQSSAKQTSLESFIEADVERVTQQFHDALSRVGSERLPVLSQLDRRAANLARMISYRSKTLTLRGRQVTDAWLAACAPKIADAEAVNLVDTAITDVGLAPLHSLEHLESLELSSPGITGSGLNGFSSTKLRNLSFQGDSGVNDAGLESISVFPQIEFLNLSDSQVTDAGLRHLAGLDSLSFLLIQRTAITDEGLSHLRNLKALEHLFLGSTDITSIAELAGLENLNTLELSETQVDDAGLAGLGAFSKLETLILSKTDVWGTGLAGLKDAKQLSVLKLNDTRVNDAALADLVELPMLTRLEVSSTRITDATLDRIARAKSLTIVRIEPSMPLTYLDIYGTNVTGDGIRRLGALNGLRELYAGGTGADDASISALSGLVDLIHLDVQGTRVSDASLEAIGKLKNLNSLNLSGTAVTGAAFLDLSGIEELRTLNLASTRISNAALDIITQDLVRAVEPDGSGGGFAWLNRLILSDTEISDAGLESVSRLKHLFALHLDGTNVGDKGLKQLALLPELQDLWLDGTEVTDIGFAGLSKSHKLRTLSLKRTSITDEVLTRIGNPIQELALSFTRVSDAGIGTLASKERLEVLELADTVVTDSALEAISRLPNLRVLDLSATPVSDRGVATLRVLPGLHELRLDRTSITDQAAESLARFGSLGKLSLNGARVTADGQALLGRRRPELAVELDDPWRDVASADGEWSIESPWSSTTLPEHVALADLGLRADVRSLSLQHRLVDEETLVELKNLANLESLDLADTSVDDVVLENLIGLPQLRHLRLSRTAISDDGLRHLAGLRVLEHLDLDGTSVTGVGLQYLRGHTALRSISLRETLLQDGGAAELAALQSLRKISVTNTRLGDAGLRELERLPALRYLDLFGTNVSDAGLESLGRMPSLSHLYLSATAVTDLGLAKLVGLKELVELGLDGCEITDCGLEYVSGLRHLTRLRLSGTRVSDAGVKTISQVTGLRKLELNDTAISDHAVGNLLKLTALEELELNGTALSDRGLEKLESLASLERLSVRDSDVSRSGIKTFKTHRPEVGLTFEPERSEFSWFGVILSVLYGVIALAICLYGTHRYLLVWLFVRRPGVRCTQTPESKYSELPHVTIQIPLFNERNVAERIITAACAMEYPRDRLQIQVLDDSTDDCADIARECCERFRSEGMNVTCLHRETREGFKSGALAAGLETATGELVAIFDADFVPSPDFLSRSVHHFTDEKVGVVQAAWRHLNRDESLLTQCQAMFLDGHLVVEQPIRAQSGRWFNFNGTAGVWRRSCIDQSGGWRHDTLTEDTDLSYRAQLAGWRFVYLPDVQADAELPSTMTAFLSQQHRWTRGLLQCAVKLMPQILSSNAPFPVKAEAWFHLTAPILYVVMFVLTALAVPATFVAVPLSQLQGISAWALGAVVLLGGTLAAATFVLVGQRAVGQSFWRTLVRLPALMALGVGMCAVNTHAAVGALLGVRSRFVRTPKFGRRTHSEADPDSHRGWRGLPAGSVELLISGVLFACFILGLSNAFALVGAPFLFLFASGFLWVGGARAVESGSRVTVSKVTHSRVPRWSAAAAVVATTVGIVLGGNSIWRAAPELAISSRVVGIDLTRVDWSVRGSSIAGTETRFDGLTLDVDLDPESESREEGEIFVDLTGPLAPIGNSLSEVGKLVFDIAYPRSFSGELQAFVSDAEGKRQYGTIAFVERHDALRRVRVGIAPASLTPAMGYTDLDFDPQQSIRRVGLKVSAQSDRVRGRGYRPFCGELTVHRVRVVPRSDSALPEIRTVPIVEIHRPQLASKEAFQAASGAVRPWPLGYAFSGPLFAEQREILEQTYAALQREGLGFSRVYIGDYRTGLAFDGEGRVTGIEPQFLEFLDDLTMIANRHGITVMFNLLDNTLLDGKGVEFPQFIVDRNESDRFVARVLAPIVEKLAGRQVIWDLFNEPENVTGAALSEVQSFVDRALMALRRSDPDAIFTVVSRSARELVYWRGRGLDVLSHNLFDQRGVDAAVNVTATTELDAPIWIAEMDPELATVKTLEDLRRAGYRGVGLWGWETGDKYDWKASDLERIVLPLVPRN